MSNRDEFPEKIKTAVAARAGWHCSFTGCAKLTVGPSDESPAAIAKIGIAAHICGAASGQGSRRYVADMSPEERAGIENAIWLCADHATLIDRDEITYTSEILRKMKRVHEAACAQAMRSGSKLEVGAGLLAIGHEIICIGDISHITADSWTLHLKHFIAGDKHKLISFIDGFATATSENKYVLSNELGDGRVLSAAPSFSKHENGYSLLCPVAPKFPRIDVQQLGSAFATHPETGDMYMTNGQIARVSGLEYLPQKVRSTLSMQRGESLFACSFGMRFFEYFETYKESPWLSLIMMLDVIRQAAIPYSDITMRQEYTPLRCVNRVHSIELLSETPKNNRLPVRVDLDVQGLGHWQYDLEIYMPTDEQQAERAQLLAKTPPLY